MAPTDPRIRNALLSLNPTAKRPAWHGAPTPLGLLRGVTPDAALHRPHPSMNCIRDIALHIAFWENSVANRLAGEAARVPFPQRQTGWPRRIRTLTAAQWKDELRYLAQAHDRLVDIVTRFDPKRLDQPAGPRSDRIAIELIHGIAEHNLYHGAQIKTLKQLAKEAGM